MTFSYKYFVHYQSWRRGTKCDCKIDWFNLHSKKSNIYLLTTLGSLCLPCFEREAEAVYLNVLFIAFIGDGGL